jgi:YegS/Rv2252/BmrU family lipid kinase
MKKKISFIINPISGHGKQQIVEKAIKQYLHKDFEVEILYTKAAKHAIELSKKASKYADIVVAVGGDGSVNEVAQGLINTDIPMGIIPRGSGNGLARFLKIPLNTVKAIALINNGNYKKIDTITINKEISINVSGVGFDAHIAHLFSLSKKRGLSSYLRIIRQEFFKYKASNYKLTFDNKRIETSAFLISFANSSQFGNNAHIAPKAIIDDGLFDVSILKPFPKIRTLEIIIRLFLKNIHHFKYFETIQTKEINIESEKDMIAHIDGEACILEKETYIKINPLSLTLIVA